jgi:hypothetical protein
MAVIEPSLFGIFMRFPDRKKSAKKLFYENEEFKSICEDYRKCCAALRYWRQSSEESAPARKLEYAALLQELEEEILRILMIAEQLES